ncbi:conserved hypothetical protein [Methanospirillum hungatei JF-1]|uniref:Uncharacterized protein n=1 Tax=Methanospirillum hungatei JF-1 (strain ATCC 27890 / DSM 864 / NBRC 100397 / JF-1) TaxID=323259 RepID=Q2FPY2_METHJ|nr:SAM-dependent methyltransferase HcgC family protein [Methanospirillum hungatei]ABD39999.1 conserved hypothetical protein [Methanospirillum hungatei JF-1]
MKNYASRSGLIYKAVLHESLFTAMGTRHKGILRTFGLGSKTSGTMTLTLEVIRSSMNAALQEEGVLYCSSHLDFFERMIFKENDLDKFFTQLLRSALIISSLKDVDPDAILKRYLSRILCQIDGA